MPKLDLLWILIVQRLEGRNIVQKKHPRCSEQKRVLGNFAKFTGKHLCQSLFLIKLQAKTCNFIKKETPTQVFSCEFFEISKKACFYRTPLVSVSAMLISNNCFYIAHKCQQFLFTYRVILFLMAVLLTGHTFFFD